MRKEAASVNATVPSSLHWLRRIFVVLSLLVWGLVVVSYLFRPDACAAVTVFPAWAWLVPGLALTGLVWAPRRGRPALALLGLWLLTALLLSDESRVLLHPQHWRPSTPLAARAPGTLRVVTYNCNGYGDAAKSSAQVLRYQPDLVLLQEVPQDAVLVNLGRQLYGKDAGVFSFVDTAILVRGKILRAARPRWGKDFCYAHARVRFTTGLEAEVFCVHLLPTNTQMDLWNPACWTYRLDIRREQRAQVARVRGRMDNIPADTPIFLGGDFNAPAGDAIYRLLQPRLHDLFAEAGVGWANTFTSDIPALRIDAIWASRHFRAHTAWVRSTPDSDHRMVICDVVVTSESRSQ